MSGGDTFSQAVQRAGSAVNQQLLAQFLGQLSPGTARVAAERETSYQMGRAAGLTDDAIGEVLTEWNWWYQQRPEPLSWTRVRQALEDRAAGRCWKSPAREQFAVLGYEPNARRERLLYWRAGIGTRWQAISAGIEHGGTVISDVGWAFTRRGAIARARRRMVRLGMRERRPWFLAAER